MHIDYLSLLSKHTAGQHPMTVPALIIHSTLVTKKALDIAYAHVQRNPDTHIDFRLLEEMGMLHDIGIFSTNTPSLFTTGEGDYITHITHGERILAEEGLPRHARAAATHINIPKEEIEAYNLTLPVKDHLPETIEEEILTLADFFYSKRFAHLFYEYTQEEIREMMRRYGEGAAERFEALAKKYL